MSGDYLDLKNYDPAMRHLIDTYIEAEASRVLATFEDTTLLEIIANEGIETAVKKLPKGIGGDRVNTAETIEANIRRLIVDKREINPKYYDKMSKLLEDLVEERKEKIIKYEEYLKKIETLTQKLIERESIGESYPESIRRSTAKKAIYDNLEGIDNREELTNKIDAEIRAVKKDGWRGNKIKEREVKNAIAKMLDKNLDFETQNLNDVVKDSAVPYTKSGLVEQIFEIVKKQDEY
jgi:type I restriction enzyme R subunit